MACRCLVVHDPDRTLGTENTSVDRVIKITLDVTDFAVLQVDFDAATARAQVAGRVLYLVVHLGRGVDLRGFH